VTGVIEHHLFRFRPFDRGAEAFNGGQQVAVRGIQVRSDGESGLVSKVPIARASFAGLVSGVLR
jgi:hypothetical protein